MPECERDGRAEIPASLSNLSKLHCTSSFSHVPRSTPDRENTGSNVPNTAVGLAPYVAGVGNRARHRRVTGGPTSQALRSADAPGPVVRHCSCQSSTARKSSTWDSNTFNYGIYLTSNVEVNEARTRCTKAAFQRCKHNFAYYRKPDPADGNVSLVLIGPRCRYVVLGLFALLPTCSLFLVSFLAILLSGHSRRYRKAMKSTSRFLLIWLRLVALRL